jgi:hypothetical protein
MKKRIIGISIFCFSLVLVLAACQQSLTAQQIWDQSFDKMKTQTSVQLSGTLDFGNVGASTNTETLPFTGALAPKGQTLLTFTMDGNTIQLLKQTINQIYFGQGSLDQVAWQPSSTLHDFIYSSSGFVFMPVIMPLDTELKTGFSTPTLAGEETINGTACYHLTVQVASDPYRAFLLQDVTLADFGLDSMDLAGTTDYWIGKSDLLFYRISSHVQMDVVVSGSTPGTQSLYIDYSVDFSNYNQPVSFPTP